uniref:Fibronectin type-III domain-containing protein n=1 Tax=Macrostomum lignano TaxID=282301 RepID=A0A1I8GCF5_9PLAT
NFTFQQSAHKLIIRFSASDPETGLAGGCFWCCGSVPGTCNLAAYIRVPDGAFWATRLMHEPEKLSGSRIFSSVRCGNGAGLWTVKVSAGILIYNGTPDASAAKLSVYSPIVSPFLAKDAFVGNASALMLSWWGFLDQVELADYQIRLMDVGQSFVARDWLSVGGSKVQSLRFGDFSLGTGRVYRVEVRAVNVLGKMSKTVAHEFRVDAKPPKLT